MNNNPIGILDSGVGGLSIWREIVKQLPHESTIYIADSRNCPYGNREIGEIRELSKRMTQFLVNQKAKLIVVACNTITVHALNFLRESFPRIPIVGTVPVVKTAVLRSKNKKIGILSTIRTAESEYQKNLITQFAGYCEVANVGTDLLVPFIEKGEIREIEGVIGEIVEPFRKAGIDSLALGCSHFPFIKKQIQQVLGLEVLILDSAAAVGRQTRRVLENNDILSGKKSAAHELFTTGNKENFTEVLLKLGFPNLSSRANIMSVAI